MMEKQVSEFRFEKIRRRKNGTFLRVDLHLESKFAEDLRTCLDRNVCVLLVDEGDRKYPIHTKVHTLFFRGEDRAVLMFKVPHSELSFKQISVSVHLGFKDGRIRSTERSTSLGMCDKSIREIVESVVKKRSRILMIRPNHCRVSSPVSCEIVYYLDDDEEGKFKNGHHIERISFGGRTSKEQSKEIQIGFSKDDHRVHLWKKKYPQSCRNVSGRGHSEFIVRPIIPPKGEKPGWVDVELVVNGTILILKKGFIYHADDDDGEEVETESRKDVIKSVRRDGMSLKNVPEKYRSDRNVVELALKQNGNALEFASGELQNDSEVVMAAIRQNWSSFKFASDELMEDKSFVLDIVSENGFALAKLPERFRKDKEVVMRAVSKNSEAIKFSSKEMREDKDVVREAVRNCWDRALEKVWAECGNGLKQDESFILGLLSLNGMLLKHLPKKLKSDKNFLCPALEQNIDIRLHVPETKSFYCDPKVRDDDVFHSSIVGFTKKLQKMFRRMNEFDSRIGGTRHSKKLVSRVYGELIRCLSERAELHHKLGNYEECIDDLFQHYQLQEKISRTMDVKLGDAILKINRAWILKAKETLDQSFYDLTSEEIRQVVENFDWVGMIGGELEEKINKGWPDYESEELLKIVEMEVRKHPEILKVRKNMEQMIPKFFYLKKQRKKKEKLSEQISPPLKEQDNRIEFLKRKKKVERIIVSTIKIFNERLSKALDKVINVLLDYDGLKSKNGRKNFGPYFSLSRQKNLFYFGFVHPETRRRYGYGVEYTQCVLNERTPSLKSKIMSYWGIGGRSKRKKSVGGGGTIHNYYNSAKTPTTQAVRNYECTCYKLFYGRYVDGYRTGKGSEFGLLDRRTNKIVTSNEIQRRKLCTKESIKKNQGLELIPIFKGKYYLGKRHGRGELYNNNNQNRETRYGEWVDNELVHEYEDDGDTLKRDKSKYFFKQISVLHTNDLTSPNELTCERKRTFEGRDGGKDFSYHFFGGNELLYAIGKRDLGDHGNIGRVKQLLESGIDPWEDDVLGFNPFVISIMLEQGEMFDLLVNKYAKRSYLNVAGERSLIRLKEETKEILERMKTCKLGEKRNAIKNKFSEYCTKMKSRFKETDEFTFPEFEPFPEKESIKIMVCGVGGSQFGGNLDTILSHSFSPMKSFELRIPHEIIDDRYVFVEVKHGNFDKVTIYKNTDIEVSDESDQENEETTTKTDQESEDENKDENDTLFLLSDNQLLEKVEEIDKVGENNFLKSVKDEFLKIDRSHIIKVEVELNDRKLENFEFFESSFFENGSVKQMDIVIYLVRGSSLTKDDIDSIKMIYQTQGFRFSGLLVGMFQMSKEVKDSVAREIVLGLGCLEKKGVIQWIADNVLVSVDDELERRLLKARDAVLLEDTFKRNVRKFDIFFTEDFKLLKTKEGEEKVV